MGKAATTRGGLSGEDAGEDLKKGQEVAATKEVLKGTSAKRVACTSEGQIEEVDEEEESAGNILEAPSSES